MEATCLPIASTRMQESEQGSEHDFEQSFVQQLEAGRVGPEWNAYVPADLAIIIPTFNEKGNVTALFRQIDAALQGVAWEAIFVDDDSSDGTIDELRELSRADRRVRYIHRIGRRGLATAVVEGMLATPAPFLAVMDCDLQHDETKLPAMLAALRSGDCDIVVGSRYVGQGSVGNWSGRRLAISQAATRLAQLVLPLPLADPMSGFFALSRETLMAAVRNMSGQGYKVLLDIILSARTPLRIREVPYTFRARQRGESKLDSSIVVDYLMLLIDKSIGRFVPARFVLFAAVGATGVIVHMAALTAALGLGVVFMAGQILATIVAMTFNFALNNSLTYRDKRLKGFRGIALGLLSFYAVCGLGAVSNVGVASILFQKNYSWWLSALAGILVGVVWNYALTSTLTWRKR
jgi:dolichol-phosphate mannosyltransferase